MDVTKFFASDLYQGKTVFITGGGSGINLGVAKTFAALGANIAICGRTQEKLDDAAQQLRELGADVVAQAADVRDQDALRAAMQTTQDQLGPIDVLIAGAAGNFPCAAEKLSYNGFKSVIDIDLMGAFNASSVAFEQLKQTRGNIIFISAGQAFLPHAWQAHVGAAKAGIDNLMRNLALEWGPYGIRSNSIVPGPIKDTEGMRRLAPADSEEKLSKLVPLQRMGTVDDIGATACFLASPLASYITGSLIMADGGMNLPGSGQWTQVLSEMLDVRQ